ncbi:MAG TPA: hypothetical protein VNO30_37230 [Kofleriaceae bacterium]|nr:hypothetical protein [Kofleriaceae bacterium]
MGKETAPSNLDADLEAGVGLDAAQEEQASQVAAGLEAHAAQHETTVAAGDVPGVNHAAMSQATEADGAAGAQATASEQAMGPGTVAAPGLDATRDARNHKEFTDREKARATATAARDKARAGGKDWTAEELADVLKKDGAQGVLVALNDRKTKQGVETLKTANQWDPLVTALPIGGMGAASCTALDQMIADNVFAIEDAKKLFHPRFGHVAQDVGSRWTQDVMRTMWRQLAVLPASDVTKSTAITTFDAIAGGGAFGPSWEAPSVINTVQIGQDIGGDHERLEHTVRHEIGHGVHTEIPGPVNAWLQNDMQFWFTDFDTWINDLGGYPASFVNSAGTTVTIDDAWKGYLRALVEGFTGSSSWDPARVTPDAGAPVDGQLAWAAMPAAIKNACAQSKSYWYSNYSNFQKVGDKRYFLNHWYHRPFTIGATAFATIPSTNDDYTAMSEKEFFANCYAEYFENPEGVTDHSKWGGTLPASVKSFFDTCIVGRHPYDQFQKKKTANKGNTP